MSAIVNRAITEKLTPIINNLRERYGNGDLLAGPSVCIAHFAADGVIIPLTGEQFAVDGLAKIINTINEVKRHGNPDLKIYGVLMNKYDQRNKLDKEMWQSLPKIGEKIGFKVFKTPIRICQEIKNTQAHRESLFDKSPSSKAAEDYSSFVKEFMKETK